LIQIVMALKPDGQGQAFQLMVGLDDLGRLWKKQLGNRFSLEWGDWELDSGKTIFELEQELNRPL
jgi:hypothetical protein